MGKRILGYGYEKLKELVKRCKEGGGTPLIFVRLGKRELKDEVLFACVKKTKVLEAGFVKTSTLAETVRRVREEEEKLERKLAEELLKDL